MILILAPAATVFAQEENDLFLVVSPSSPAPNQGFSVEAKTFQFDASRAYFEWFKDGKKIDEGVGITKKIFPGEKLGTRTRISAVSAENSASADISVNDIDFIINSFTYTPFGYRGAALATPGSVAEIYAIPHIFSNGRRISSTGLTYEWSIEGSPVQEQSGRGKNKLTISIPKIPQGDVTVSLNVFSGEQLVAQKKEKVEIHSPQIVFYKTNSLLGKGAKALSEFTSPPGAEFALAAEPFFFDFNSIVRGVVSWLANGTKIEPSRADNLFVLELSSAPNEESESNILFKIGDEKNVFQNKEGRINIKIRN
ncbi:MAG: hypothetical protein AAB556_00185 [Patescibacteria group bacterium]